MRRVLATMESSLVSKLMLRAALLSAVCALSLAPARAGQSVKPYSSMLAGAVTYTLPEGWRIIMYMNTSLNGAAQIINTEKGMDQPKAQIFLSAYSLREKKTVGDVGNDTFGSKRRKDLGGTVLSDKADGNDWRTVVWTTVINGEPHLILEHFGVVDRKFVALTVFVSLGSGDVKWMKQAVEDFNAVCKSLKIDGQGSFESKVSTDIITEQLKVKAKK
jgi:hypothetical protein